ncbi:hypothetical protein [Kribbella karoonensis]|uniref:Uncharacterized protein n=1 Tax=Kribbella karoonensis TaxID=324851 RepID=A0ABN2E400_9ACTN
MPNAGTTYRRLTTERLARAAAAVLLGAVAVVHILELGDQLAENKLVGYAFIALIAAAVIAAAALIAVPSPRVWGPVGVLAAGALAAYLLSRTTGLPTDSLEVGNWNCTLGIAALTTETLVLSIVTWQLWRRRTAPEPSATAVAEDAEL